MSSCRACALFVVMLMLAPRSARAQPATADALIEQGIQQREHGHDDEALAFFQRAYALAPTPRALSQMGLAEQALGHWTLAETHLQDALATPNDAWIEGHRAVLSGALGTIARHLGFIEVRGGIEGAEVFLDGTRLGKLPLARAERVEVGTRTLEVRAAGYYPIARTVIIGPGATARETIDLVAQAKPMEPTSPPPPAATVARATPAEPKDAPSAGGAQRTIAWVGLGAATLFLATGVVAVVERQSEVSAYNDDRSCPGMGSASQPAACADRMTAASTWSAVTVVGFVGAGALAATSLVLLLTAPSRDASHTALACGGGVGFVTCGARF